jgi:5-methyltetrahydropteroyltriglutamate--homocysteine methyltransferase
VETPEEVAGTIETALQFVDAERLSPCTNCGMAPLPRAVAAGKLRALGEGARLAKQKLGAR